MTHSCTQWLKEYFASSINLSIGSVENTHAHTLPTSLIFKMVSIPFAGGPTYLPDYWQFHTFKLQSPTSANKRSLCSPVVKFTRNFYAERFVCACIQRLCEHICSLPHLRIPRKKKVLLWKAWQPHLFPKDASQMLCWSEIVTTEIPNLGSEANYFEKSSTKGSPQQWTMLVWTWGTEF